MGVDEQNLYAEARGQANQAERQYQRTLPMWAEQSRAAVQGVYDDAETRGVYRSGATLRNAARARSNVAMEQGEARAQASDTARGYNLDAARRVAEIRRQSSETALGGRATAGSAASRAVYG